MNNKPNFKKTAAPSRSRPKAEKQKSKKPRESRE